MGRRADDWRPLPAVVVILLLGMLLAAGLMVQALRPSPAGFGGAHVAGVSGLQEVVTAPRAMSDARRRSAVHEAGHVRAGLDRELARAIVLRQPGVVSSIWLDRLTLLARVDGPAAHGSDTLRALCRALAEAGDAAGMQIQLQNARARTSRELEPLVLQCGAGLGMVRRHVYPPSVAPEVRAVYRDLAPSDAVAARQRADAAARVIRRTTPEMR